MSDVTILFTCAGMRVDIVRAFQHELRTGPHSGRVLVSDSDELAPSRWHADGVVDLPNVSDAASYTEALREVCAREGVDAVLPLTDLDPVVLAECRDVLGAAGTRVLVPAPDVALACLDKLRCDRILRDRGLPSPDTRPAGEVDPAAFDRPVLVKPRIGFAARNITLCEDAATLAATLRRVAVDEFVVQEAFSRDAGQLEFSIDCMGDMDGRAVGAIPRAMLQAKGGEQIKGETLDDAQLVELGVRTVEALGLRGPSTVQCFRDAAGTILGITDINTRFGGGFPLPLAAGGGYPAAVIAMAAGVQPVSTVGRHRVGVVMTRHLEQTILVRTPDGLARPAAD